MSDSEPVLDRSGRRMAEDLLANAWGAPVRVDRVERIWGRHHVLRLTATDGRSAVVKRLREQGPELERRRALVIEFASLRFLSAMPEAVAPQLLGGDPEAGLLVLEDLPAGRSLADSLLLGDRPRASADLIAYARGLAKIHAWSIGRTDDLVAVRQRYAPSPMEDSWWLQAFRRGTGALCALGAEVGVDAGRVQAEVDQALSHLGGATFRGFVHGDPCPDNVRLVAGDCRIFDFEASSIGSVALDAAFLAAPFPSCWCFGRLPPDLAAAALDAYWETMGARGLRRNAEWDVAIASALACFVGARADALERFLGWEWGTTGGAARILSWTVAAIAAAEAVEVFPALRAIFSGLRDRARPMAQEESVPAYPALAPAGAVRAKIPDWWQPNL